LSSEPQADGGGVPQEMSIPDAIKYSLDLIKDRRFEAAEELYRRILAVAPACPEAWHFRGMLAVQMGRIAEGEELIRKAVEIQPDYADAHNNLGNVLQVLQRYEEAIGFYELAIMFRPTFADAHYNLGRAHDGMQRAEEAVTAYRQALLLGHFHPDVHRHLGWALYGMGRVSEAADIFARWLTIEPGSEVARHMLAACSGKEVPARASDGCVQSIFDRFADSFDEVLHSLKYEAPGLVANMIIAQLPPPAGDLDVLDAGCGTGLCAAGLRPYARRLVGVDLSPEMLKRAVARKAYDHLVEGELVAFLQGEEAAFDLVASADTLVYFGDLAPFAAAAARALRPGGRLVFTVERAEDAEVPDGYRINPHGRYSHTEAYLRATLGAAGLTVDAIERADLRLERHVPVGGFVVASRR
jgi:predicted TPR repeat methyltransferase